MMEHRHPSPSSLPLAQTPLPTLSNSAPGTTYSHDLFLKGVIARASLSWGLSVFVSLTFLFGQPDGQRTKQPPYESVTLDKSLTLLEPLGAQL